MDNLEFSTKLRIFVLYSVITMRAMGKNKIEIIFPQRFDILQSQFIRCKKNPMNFELDTLAAVYAGRVDGNSGDICIPQ